MSEEVDLMTAGGLAYVDDRMQDARSHWEAAFQSFNRAGYPAAAARAATLLAELHWGGLGNPSTGRGWLERARRLLDGCGRCVELGYWELARLACDRADPGETEDSARRALVIAAEFGDTGLHVRALGDLGFALVTQGQLASGFALLDESLAALTGGEILDPFVVSTTWCALLSACDRAGDADRATEWLRLVRETVLAPAGGRPRMLGAHCQLALGGVMCTVGDWATAETTVRALLEQGSGATSVQRAEAASRLAELYIQRGRLEEAAALLGPLEVHPVAAAAFAQLYLARSEPQYALAVLSRLTTALGSDVLRRGDLLLLTTRAALAATRTDLALDAVTQLRALTDDSDSPVVAATADLAEGLYLAATADLDGARARFGAARTELMRANRPALEAQTWLALAHHAETDADAVLAARAAYAIAVRLDAHQLRDQSAAILRRHGATTPRVASSPGALPDLTPREVEILEGLRRGDTNAQIAARMYLSPKTVEHHVGRVLAKLGVRTRAEAAAYAATASAPSG